MKDKTLEETFETVCAAGVENSGELADRVSLRLITIGLRMCSLAFGGKPKKSGTHVKVTR